MGAQQLAQRPGPAAPRSLAYDATRETALTGTVVSYTPSSTVAPLGAHVVLQTASGQVDVHLGPASFLQSNNFSLASGDAVRVVGVSVQGPESNLFLARVLQKGGQFLALRTANGAPIGPAGARAAGAAKTAKQDGAR